MVGPVKRFNASGFQPVDILIKGPTQILSERDLWLRYDEVPALSVEIGDMWTRAS